MWTALLCLSLCAVLTPAPTPWAPTAALSVPGGMGLGSIHWKMKWGSCGHSTAWTTGCISDHGAPTYFEGRDLVCSHLSCCTQALDPTSLVCVCCLFPLTLNHAQISSLGVTYLSFNLDPTALHHHGAVDHSFLDSPILSLVQFIIILLQTCASNASLPPLPPTHLPHGPLD